MKRIALVLCILGSQGTAQTAPDKSETPEPRPDPEDRGIELEIMAETKDALPQNGVRNQLKEDDADFAACLSELDAFGAVYDTTSPVRDADPDCGIERAVTVTEVVPGVTLNPDSRMRCETARALAEWMAVFVIPASSMMENRGRISGIEHGSTYICRRRNNSSDGKLSEHAFGNAIDVMGFRFEDGDSIRVEPRERDGTIEEAFQDAVRAAACLSFTTVLGPGTDAAHADHLHLDVKARGGGFRLCQ